MFPRKKFIFLGFLFLTVICCLPFSVNAENLEKFRVGYLEGGPYWIFTEEMAAIKKALEKSGWGDRLEFPKDAHFSPGWGEGENPEWILAARKLMARDDLDLIIGAGTDAVGALLKVNNNRTPIVGISVSDPIRSGFVENEEDSGVDNFTVRIVPNRYERMFLIFHEVVGFQKLGLIYSQTESGRRFTNLDEAHQVAKERGFEIIEHNQITENGTVEECLEGLKDLVARGMDAFFIPSLVYFDWTARDVKVLFDYLMDNDIPTFARNGTRDVKAGALMGFSTVDFSKRGEFVADKIIKILEGAKPRSLQMVDNAIPMISINLYVAEQIDFNPSFDILAASDELFQEITLPEDRLVK